MGLNDVVLSKTKVRNGVYALRLQHGSIEIKGELFMFYTMREAISIWRRNNPIR